MQQEKLKKKIEETTKSLLIETAKEATVNHSQKSMDIDSKLRKIENDNTTLKTLISDLENYLQKSDCYLELLKLEGIERLMRVLDREEKKNREGSRNNFTNQMEILRFIRVIACKNNPKVSIAFAEAVQKVPNYVVIILRNFHPVNIAISAYVLELLTDYIWRTDDSERALEQLKSVRRVAEGEWSLIIFTETLINTNNILMVFYVLKFINELLASFVDDEEMIKFKK